MYHATEVKCVIEQQKCIQILFNEFYSVAQICVVIA